MNSDLAVDLLLAGLFGDDAAWWASMILAHNLNTAMRRLVMGTGWPPKRMKALRPRLIGLPGRADNPACKLIIRPGRTPRR